ncbi:MAG: RICIN domain-containing protein [Bacteroidetes bacterium]|uniref:RICIN domain-containing protein n=1 Tax=Candidatus Enterocola intestinipullorum TaxID=2840783 RepID=A0A9D9EG35_9BACT|nr:RICIN domain-containing protein [Candidatus Enterocola intestinipullorum]
MKRISFLFVWLLCIPAMLFAESGVYVGGHIRRERPSTIEKLKKSGFSYVILFNINVESDGTLTCDGETVCKDGVYVFGNTQPEYVSDITSLKQWPTNIRRIDICIGGWGNESYSRIQSLVNSQGTGSGSILYRNFKALKEALPVIDGVNNDDEHCYDVASAASFHIMMSDLGYKTSLAPYMNRSYWENLATRINSERPGACDRVMVQCYDGGAGNNPCDWHINGLPLYAGRTNYQSSMEESISQMQSWKDNCGVSGGFVWVYNDETWDLNDWATRMNRIFGSYQTAQNSVVTVCSDMNYGGYAVGLPLGEHDMAALAAYGIINDDISSLKVPSGYKVTLYDNSGFGGESRTYTSDASYVGDDFNDRCTSIKVSTAGVSGKGGLYKLQNRNSGLYMDVNNNSTENNANVVVFADEQGDPSQFWQLAEVGEGIYSIKNYRSGKVLDIMDNSTDNGAVVQQYDDYSAANQQFILLDAADGYYYLAASHCGKVVEVPSSSLEWGEWCKLYDNNGSATQQWKLVDYKPQGYAVATVYKDADYKGSSLGLPEGSYNATDLALYGIGADQISSLKVTPGYRVILYDGDNFDGENVSYTGDTNHFPSFNDKTSSIRVEASGVSGKSGVYKLKNRNSGLYMDVENNSTDNNAPVVQYVSEGDDPSQLFEFAEVGNGVYSITNKNSGKSFDIADNSTDNRALVQLYDYLGYSHQQFILIAAPDGYYQLAARHCGKVVEVPESKTDLGEWLKTWDNNGSATQQWKLVTDFFEDEKEEDPDPAPDIPENPADGDVRVIVTSGDRSRLLAEMDGLQFGETYSTTSTITVNSSETYQEIDGFGFTLTEGSAEVIMSLTSDKQEELLYDLFNPETGIGVSVIRLGIGATDLSSSVYSYNDNDGDTDMSEFSLEGPDMQYTIPVLLKALAINPDIKVMATPWSAPEWMKFDNNYLNNDYYSAYALYFVKYLQAMQAYGIDIWAVTPQNEPLNTTNNPSMGMTKEDQYTFVNNYLGPQLESAGFGNVKIICYDHNCDNTEFPIYVSQSSYVDGTAFHLYAGDISAMTDVYNRTGKGVYFTEQYTGAGGDFQGDFSWHLRNVVIGGSNNWAKTILEWNLANNSSMGPHTEGGCDTCLGAITVENSTSYTKNVAYYIIAQASKFVKPGAVRLGCSSTSLPATAFKNTDGSYVVICHNENTDYTHTTTITIDGQSFSYEIPAGSAATFVWGVSDSGDDSQGGEDEEETPSGTYDYWVVCRDELPDGEVLDLRACPLYVWENTLVGTTVQDAAEGSDAIAFTISASTGSWFGGGYNTGSIEVGLSQIADYNLYFSYKTDYSGQLQVKISGTNGEFAVGFDHTPDLQWHSTYIPMSEFVSAGLQLGTMDNWLAFGIVGENTISTGNYLSLDNIYYAKSRIPGDTGEEDLPTSVDLDDTGSGIYLWPNPADDYVYVENVEAGETIKVVDLSGRVVLSSVADGSVLDVAGLQQGTYLLVVSGKALKFMVK